MHTDVATWIQSTPVRGSQTLKRKKGGYRLVGLHLREHVNINLYEVKKIEWEKFNLVSNIDKLIGCMNQQNVNYVEFISS